jgi:four helix bundle protein
MDDFAEQLRNRTKRFALRIMKMTESLPNNPEGWVLGKQILRSGTSIGANYRAATRAKSRPDFIAKLGIVVEEADETQYWLELLAESGLLEPARLRELQKEAAELTAIFTASRNTAKSRQMQN